MVVKVLGYVFLSVLIIYAVFSIVDFAIKLKRRNDKRRAEQLSNSTDSNGAECTCETDENKMKEE